MKQSFWQRFKAGLFSKAQFITGVAIFLLISSAVLYAYDVLTFNVFTAGQTISAAQVNDNFAKINSIIGKLNKKFVVGLTTNRTINSPFNSNTYDLFNTVVVDATGYSYANNLVANNSFVLQESGLYDIKLLGHVSSTDVYPEIYLEKTIGTNTFPVTSVSYLYNFSSPTLPAIGGGTYYLNSGEVISVRLFSYDGSTAGSYQVTSGKTKLVFEKID